MIFESKISDQQYTKDLDKLCRGGCGQSPKYCMCEEFKKAIQATKKKKEEDCYNKLTKGK